MKKSLLLGILFILIYSASAVAEPLIIQNHSGGNVNSVYRGPGGKVKVQPINPGNPNSEPAVKSQQPPFPEADETGKSIVPPGTPKAWALATTALLIEVNKERHDLLGGRELSRKNIQRARNLLSKWWGVNNRQDLLTALSWVEKEGHRKDCIATGTFVASLGDQDYADLVDKLEQAQDKEGLHRVRILREYFEELGGKSLIGWDFARYIALCRWGFAARYMSEDEAWERIMPVAEKLQATFGSWEDLGENYVIGREYWSHEETSKTGELMLTAHKRLLSDPESPWMLNPWDMDLQGGD